MHPEMHQSLVEVKEKPNALTRAADLELSSSLSPFLPLNLVLAWTKKELMLQF